MRLVIKNANFLSVSIGKVVKDLSFSFDSADGVNAINAFFPNYNSGGDRTKTHYYTGSEGSTVVDAGETSNRLATDYIEVTKDMVIQGGPYWYTGNVASEPCVVAFDSNKNIISASCVWLDSLGSSFSYTVPNGVKYIKIMYSVTSSALSHITNGDNSASGTMPE